MVSGVSVQVPDEVWNVSLYTVDYYFVFGLLCLLIWGLWPIPRDIRSRVWDGFGLKLTGSGFEDKVRGLKVQRLHCGTPHLDRGNLASPCAAWDFESPKVPGARLCYSLVHLLQPTLSEI